MANTYPYPDQPLNPNAPYGYSAGEAIPAPVYNLSSGPREKVYQTSSPVPPGQTLPYTTPQNPGGNTIGGALYPDFSMTTVYQLHPLCLGNATNKVVFTGVLGEPTVLPELTQEINVTPYTMRAGNIYSGKRIFLARGGDASYDDIEFTSIVTPTQLAFLRSMYLQDPSSPTFTGMTYSPDNGTTLYSCIFQKKGLVPKNLEFNLRIFTGVSIKLHILNADGVSLGADIDPQPLVNNVFGS